MKWTVCKPSGKVVHVEAAGKVRAEAVGDSRLQWYVLADGRVDQALYVLCQAPLGWQRVVRTSVFLTDAFERKLEADLASIERLDAALAAEANAARAMAVVRAAAQYREAHQDRSPGGYALIRARYAELETALDNCEHAFTLPGENP